ncbi:MAG: indole-3-glycerol phosphate synthase TrpC [Abditibacteriales bacterium]|nr:indole-3-glycerol phosphate synthase TrpC [Abditibacteriales bacterium]MDW8366598.1 indole-3-glycerol phosphate synthase TrpC [Abditibacteriales bacterium]
MILDRIVEAKQLELAQAKQRRPLRQLEREIAKMDAPRPFADALRREDRIALVAEIKKASPSAGVIRADFDPVDIAQIYDESAADAISVLTDEKFFQGHLDFIGNVRRVSAKPVLRKDFLFDEYQVIESRAFGADAILLIVAILGDKPLARLLQLAEELGMAALVETHEEEEVKRALDAGARLMGVNNRDLRDFSVDLNTTLRLRPLVPPEVTLVSESGIHTREDVRVLEAAGVNAILVGESLMRSADMRRKIDELLGLR